MKYITFNDQSVGPSMVCFSDGLSHAHVAKCMGIREPKSAGFITQTNNDLWCHGHSESLGVASKVGDSDLAKIMFRQ